MDERPYFEKEGSPHHPDDPYAVESVRNPLSAILRQPAVGEGQDVLSSGRARLIG